LQILPPLSPGWRGTLAAGRYGRSAELACYRCIDPRRGIGEIDMTTTKDNLARIRVAGLIYAMVNAVVFGGGLLTVLLTPALAQDAFFWIPLVVACSFAVSIPVSWAIAPSMMVRFAGPAHRR
jgi:hypothetical protein